MGPCTSGRLASRTVALLWLPCWDSFGCCPSGRGSSLWCPDGQASTGGRSTAPGGPPWMAASRGF
eukprot:2629692-Alexandrium_andersonii.AAC.1